MDKKNLEIAKEYVETFILRNGDDKIIKEIEKKYNKSRTHIKRIVEDYLDYVADEGVKAEFLYIKKQKQKQGTKYKRIIENLVQMNEKEREEYIKKEEIGKDEIGSYIRIYMKKYPNVQLEELKKWSLEFYKSDFKKEQEQKREEMIKIVEQNVNEMIENGYCFFEEYANDFYQKYSKDKFSFTERVKNAYEYVRLNIPEMHKYYKKRIDINKKLIFESLKNKIREFIDNIENLDIVDYYLIFHMPINLFMRLCRDNIEENDTIEQQDIHKLNKFFGNYVELEKMIYTDEDALQSKIYFGKTPSMEDKVNTLEFMKKNNIPNVYFQLALKKYVNGNLIKKCK